MFAEKDRLRIATLRNNVIIHATGKRAAALALEECREGDLVVVNVKVEQQPECDVMDVVHLRETGSIALWIEGETLRRETARQRQGARLWTQ